MTPELWAEIRRLYEVEHCSVSEIGRRLGLDRKTVRTALKAEHVPQRRASAGRTSKLDEYKQYIVDRLNKYPRLTALALYEEILRMGYSGKITILTEILQAMEHACTFNAYGAPYLNNIILQQRAARGAEEPVPITIPSKPLWIQVSVEQQDLALYYDLYNDDTEVIDEQNI